MTTKAGHGDATPANDHRQLRIAGTCAPLPPTSTARILSLTANSDREQLKCYPLTTRHPFS